jgi:hypothetical protein
VPGRILDVLQRHSVAALALFLALAGSSYAAVTLGPGSVGSSDCQPRGPGGGSRPRGRDDDEDRSQCRDPSRIAPDAVNSDDVADGSLTLDDFMRGQIPAIGPVIAALSVLLLPGRSRAAVGEPAASTA